MSIKQVTGNSLNTNERIDKNRLLTGWVAAGLVFIGWNVVSYQAYKLKEDTFTTTNTIEVGQTDDFIALKAKAARCQMVLFFPGH